MEKVSLFNIIGRLFVDTVILKKEVENLSKQEAETTSEAEKLSKTREPSPFAK